MVEELQPSKVREYLCAIAIFFNKARPSTHFEGGRRPLKSHFSGLVDIKRSYRERSAISKTGFRSSVALMVEELQPSKVCEFLSANRALFIKCDGSTHFEGSVNLSEFQLFQTIFYFIVFF